MTVADLTYTIEKSAEINLIDIVGGGNATEVSPGVSDYTDWTATQEVGDSGAGSYSHTHTITAVTYDPNFMVIGFFRNDGNYPTVSNVQVDGVAATFIAQTKNGYFTQNNAGLALYYILKTAQWSGSATITYDLASSSGTAADAVAVISGYANTGSPALLDSGSTTWLTGNNTINYDAGSSTGVTVMFFRPGGLTDVTGGLAYASVTGTTHLSVVEDVFTGAESVTMNGSVGSQAIWAVMGDSGNTITVTDTVTLTLPNTDWERQDDIKVTVS